MSQVAGTLGYLVTRTLRNRVITMARRVRQPKYALGLTVGVAYFGLLIFGQTRGGSGAPGLIENETIKVLAPLLLALILVAGWFTSGAQSALAFTQAEVAMLFPAPVMRRDLIVYKLAGAQVGVIINAIIFAYLFGRGPESVPRWLSVVSLWAMFSTINLHRVGAALVRASAAQHGLAGAKRAWISYVLGIVVLVVLMTAVVSGGHGQTNDSDPLAFMNRFAQVTSLPAVRVVLFPFALIVGPAFAQTLSEWALSMLPALAMLAAHLIWVLRSDVAFEEAAAEASEKRQQALDNMRRRGLSGADESAPAPKRTLALQSVGHPAMAIVWKNVLGLMRTLRASQLITILVVPAVAAVLIGRRAGDTALVVAGMAAMIAMVMFVSGPMTVRNDLRADLLNLESLKTYPLRGRDLVLAEVTSSALPLALMQLVLLVVAVVALQFSHKPLPLGVTIAVVITLPAALFGLNLCYSTLQNGVAVLFPGWVRLGSEGQGIGAIDVMGQAILTMFAMLVAFLICMIVPAVVVFVVFILVKPPAVLAVSFVMVVGALAVIGESYAMMIGLGRVVDRLEPAQIG